MDWLGKARARVRRENEEARTIRPRASGGGGPRDSAVEGAPDSELRCRRKAFAAKALLKIEMLERSRKRMCKRRRPRPLHRPSGGPLPRYRGGG